MLSLMLCRYLVSVISGAADEVGSGSVDEDEVHCLHKWPHASHSILTCKPQAGEIITDLLESVVPLLVESCGIDEEALQSEEKQAELKEICMHLVAEPPDLKATDGAAPQRAAVSISDFGVEQW